MDTILVNRRRQQRGVSLILALIMLAAMMMSGIAMFRKLGGASMLASNLAFTSSAIGASDQGSEAARAWLISRDSAALSVVSPGYFPASCYTSAADALTPVNCEAAGAPAPFDAPSFAWDDASSTLVTPDDGAGNEVRYVVHRLCSMAGSLSATSGAAAQQCVYSTTTTVVDRSGTPEITTSISPLFRITTRVRGPRNTAAYTQITMF